MAIGGGDGSIILTTKVDTAGVTTGITKVKAAVTKAKTSLMGIGTTISKGFTTAFATLSAKLKSLSPMITKMIGFFALMFSVQKIRQFISESKELYKIQMQNEVKLATVMRQRMKATDEQIQQMLDLTAAEQARGIIGDEVQIAGLQQLATFASQKETIETLLPAMNNLIAQQYGYEASTESARNAANLMGKVLQGQTGALTRVGITFSAAEEAALKTGNEMERAAVLAQVITNNVGEMNQALAKTDVGRQQQLANTFGDIKEQFGAAFTQLSILFLPALQFLANVLATIAQLARAAAQAIANMFGKEITENTQATQSSIGGSVGGMEDLADATKKAGKEAKKATANFDDLQILTSNASGGSGGSEIETAGGGIAGGGAIGTGFDFGIQGKAGEIDAEMSAIMGIAGGALAAIGLLLMFFGHPLWGVSFLIMGATALGVSLTTLSQSDAENLISEKLMKILAIAGTALTALGLILLFSGVWKWGIAFIVAGAAALGVAIVATESGKVDKEAEEMLINIMTIAGAAMLALGVILLCFGVVSPLSIGLVVAGAASLAGAIALNPHLVFENVSKFFTDNAGLIVGISLALLVLGIVLCVCGIVTPLSIGMIVAGAAGLATEIVLNWNYITEKVTQFFRDNAGLIVGVSTALIVLGIILLFTGVGIPLAIGLIVAGGGALAATVALNWNFIVDKVKEVWGKVKEFWNTHIAPIFTAEWWKNLGKKVMNGLIAGFEAGINGIIGMFEKMINWIVNGLNKISFDVPDWLPGIGGKTFGFNIPEVKFGRVSIPRLAKGAVIPANKQFLAVLGDQRHGTNIEAPLDTIVEAMNIALMQNGAGQTTKEEHYYLGETELMSVIYKLVKGGERLQGQSLLSGGGY